MTGEVVFAELFRGSRIKSGTTLVVSIQDDVEELIGIERRSLDQWLRYSKHSPPKKSMHSLVLAFLRVGGMRGIFLVYVFVWVFMELFGFGVSYLFLFFCPANQRLLMVAAGLSRIY